MSTKFNEYLAEELKHSIIESAKKIDPQLAFDIIGIFDPTPISDGVSTGMSLYKREWIDALLGITSMVPYLGDGLAKPYKIARRYGKPGIEIAKKLKTWMKGKTDDMLSALGRNHEGVNRARERAAEAVRNAQKDKRLNGKKCNTEACKEVRRSNMPSGKNGRWDPPDARKTGNGTYTFKDANGVEYKVPYKDGYPDFSNYNSTGRFHIENPTGNVGADAKALKDQHGIIQPPNTTLHHFEDGTVGYVDSTPHDLASHTGFRSIQNTDLY